MKKTISFAAIAVSLVVLSCLLVMGSYLVFEPEEVRSATATSSIEVTLSVTEEITLSPPLSAIAMNPAISVSVSQSNGSGDWNVKTNATAGYDLKFHASTTPALKSSANEFANATADNVNWGTGSGEACQGVTLCFGFKVSGTDAAAGFLNWSGFSTSPKTVATRGSATPVAGINTTMDVQAEQFGVFAPSGSYSADIIGTATTDK